MTFLALPAQPSPGFCDPKAAFGGAEPSLSAVLGHSRGFSPQDSSIWDPQPCPGGFPPVWDPQPCLGGLFLQLGTPSPALGGLFRFFPSSQLDLVALSPSPMIPPCSFLLRPSLQRRFFGLQPLLPGEIVLPGLFLALLSSLQQHKTALPSDSSEGRAVPSPEHKPHLKTIHYRGRDLGFF